MCRSFEICDRAGLLRVLQELVGREDVRLPDGVRAGGTAYPGTFAPVIVSEASGSGADAAFKAAIPRVVTPEDAMVESAGATSTAFKPADPEVAASDVTSHDIAARTAAETLFPLEVREFGFGWPLEWKKETAFNARFDSLLQGKAPWGDVLARRRCILPCAAFHESHRSEKVASPKTGKLVKRRYSFMAPDGGPLLLAAVYEGECFSVVTTEPNADVASVHDRMPLVLTVEEARLWLDPAVPIDRIARLADRSAVRLRAQGEGRKLPDIVQPAFPL